MQRKIIKNSMLAIICNVLIIIFEIFSFYISIKQMGRLQIEYYTQDSNILALIASLIFVIYSIILVKKKKEFPKWVSILKYISVCSLAVTLLVVVCVLAPMFDNGYKTLLFSDSMLYHHTICPIIAIISFIFFERHLIDGIKDELFAISFTIFYAIVSIILNLLKVLEGPYPFLYVYDQPIYMSIIWVVTILGGAYLISLSIGEVSRKVNLKG